MKARRRGVKLLFPDPSSYILYERAPHVNPKLRSEDIASLLLNLNLKMDITYLYLRYISDKAR